jgi:hypothetical protein
MGVAVAIDYVVDLDCLPKQALTVERMVSRQLDCSKRFRNAESACGAADDRRGARKPVDRPMMILSQNL